MINHLFAFVITLIVHFSGYDVLPTGHIDLCYQSINVDNVDRVVYMYPYGYIAHFSFDDQYTNVIILDNCFDFSAYRVSPDSIERIDF